MAGAVMFVLFCANVITSLIRNLLKPHLRIVIFTLTIATFVTIADRFLAAYLYQMSKTLGPYIPLIIVNCLIICRCEVCASKQSVFTAAADALGRALVFGIGLWQASPAVREILGTGMLFRYPHAAGGMAGLGHHGPAAGCLYHFWSPARAGNWYTLIADN